MTKKRPISNSPGSSPVASMPRMPRPGSAGLSEPERSRFRHWPTASLAESLEINKQRMLQLRGADPNWRLWGTGEPGPAERKAADLRREIEEMQVEYSNRNADTRTVDEAVGSKAGKSAGKPQAQAVADPEVAKRRALVKANGDVKASELCEIFDRTKVPLPSKWQAAGVQSWSQAYLNAEYRKRIDVIISKDR